MRVISGSAKGRRLVPPQDRRVRPTSDRIKEALFSIIISRRGDLAGCAILDLFAGTGNLGIEALSRGAAKALFVDNHRESTALVRKNLQGTGLEEFAEVMASDTFAAIARLAAAGRRFDLILADPPYNLGLAEKLLGEPALERLLAEESLLVIETSDREELPKSCGNLTMLDRRIYGDTAIAFYTLVC